MKRIIYLSAILISSLFISCGTPGEKLADEACDCFEKSKTDRDAFKKCQKEIREKAKGLDEKELEVYMKKTAECAFGN